MSTCHLQVTGTGLVSWYMQINPFFVNQSEDCLYLNVYLPPPGRGLVRWYMQINPFFVNQSKDCLYLNVYLPPPGRDLVRWVQINPVFVNQSEDCINLNVYSICHLQVQVQSAGTGTGTDFLCIIVYLPLPGTGLVCWYRYRYRFSMHHRLPATSRQKFSPLVQVQKFYDHRLPATSRYRFNPLVPCQLQVQDLLSRYMIYSGSVFFSPSSGFTKHSTGTSVHLQRVVRVQYWVILCMDFSPKIPHLHLLRCSLSTDQTAWMYRSIVYVHCT